MSQVLATAALLDGYDVAALDQTGLSQKGGPVISHVRINEERGDGVPAVGVGHADCYLAFDLVVAADPKHLVRALPDRTLAVVSTSHVPTGQQVSHPQAPLTDHDELAAALARSTRKDDNVWFDASAPVRATVRQPHAGQHAGARRGVPSRGSPHDGDGDRARHRAQRGVGRHEHPCLPMGSRHRHRPVAQDGGTARALDRRTRSTPAARQRAVELVREAALPAEVAALAELRAELIDYQSARLAQNYLDLVARAAGREAQVAPGQHRLAEAVARYYFKLLAYKDEYEVARLHLRPELEEAVGATFGEDAGQLPAPPAGPAGARVEAQDQLRAVIGPGAARLAIDAPIARHPLDLFGRTAMRRLERELPEEYRAMIEGLLALSPDTW